MSVTPRLPLVCFVPSLARQLLVSVAFSCLLAHKASAEPVLDRALSGTRLLTKGACSIVKVEFNFRVRYVSHFPIGTGDELRVTIRPLDPGNAAALATLRREAVRAPADARAAIKAIEFEPDQPGGATLRVTFHHPVAFQVAPGTDFESLILAVPGKKPNAACKPEFPARLGTGWDTSLAREPGTGAGLAASLPAITRELSPSVRGNVTRAPGAPSAKEEQEAAAAMDEARAAIKKGNFPQAVELLRKVTAKPEMPFSAEAQELLGVAHHKAGQMADARLVWEDYLARYPAHEGTDRVRQRLSGLLTATGEAQERLRAAKMLFQDDGTPQRKPGATWTTSGSISQFYIRDDSFRTLRDASLAPNLAEDKDAHIRHQNTLMTSFDLAATFNNDKVKAKFRFSGAEEHRFNDDSELVRVAALFSEVSFKDLDLMTRIGRQTRSAGGVLGRFDGALASWQAAPSLRFNVVAGSPVELRQDSPFKNDRYFYGGSIDFGPILNGIEASVFAIEQRSRGWLDRQAVGTELRYLDQQKSGFLTVDYDIHFQQLNAAIASGSWTFSDKSVLHLGGDYRKAPYMTAWNALQGQPFATLYDMLKVRTKQEVDQLALDRTPTYQSATIGYSYPLTEKLQASLDVTAANMSGTVASGGVDAMLPMGTEYYLNAQLIANGLFSEGDLYIGALRFADKEHSDLYVVDLSARYPMTREFRVNPRLRLGYEVGKDTDLQEYTLLPSLLLNYYWTKDFVLELEVGNKWRWREQAGMKETESELFITAGFRYDFYADGQSKCRWLTGCPDAKP